DARAADYGGAIHEPDRVLSGRAVAPQDVDLAVTVEVTRPGEVPVQVRERQDRGAARDGAADHEPDRVLTGALVVPQDVGLPVAVEITDPDDRPVRVGYRGGVRGAAESTAI